MPGLLYVHNGFAQDEMNAKIVIDQQKAMNAITTLLDQMLASPDGKMVALGDIAEVRYVNIKQSISRKDF